MVTTRGRSKEERDSSRLPAAVARELELTAVRRARLRVRRNDLPDLCDREDELHAVEGRECARRDR